MLSGLIRRRNNLGNSLEGKGVSFTSRWYTIFTIRVWGTHFSQSLVTDYILYKEITQDLAPSAPLSQFNQFRKGIVDEPIARHGQSCAVMAGDRSVASDETRKLNFWSIIEGAILQLGHSEKVFVLEHKLKILFCDGWLVSPSKEGSLAKAACNQRWLSWLY